jgi:serine/threonine protein kinase
MELMDTSLDRFYTKRLSLFQTGSVVTTMPELFLSKVAHSVLSGLEFMRKLKLMHRDIKPSNVLLNETGEMKLCDFGISGVTMNSMCKTINGTQMYMPPEKIDPKGSGYSSRSDVWSLGISLIEVGVGEHPFKNASGLLGLMNKIVIIDSPKLDSTKFSQEFCQFIDKWYIYIIWG